MIDSSTLALTTTYLKKILDIFPFQYSYSFAYGSAVFKQAINSSPNENVSKLNMIDLILVTNCAQQFHKNNLAKNPSHYSFLKYTSSELITKFQTNFGAKVYYNTLIPIIDENGNKRFLKYGVIEKKDFINDLLDWDHLYMSGRLHKPVKTIHTPQDKIDQENFFKAIGINYQNALYASLLLLSDNFSEEQLYLTIAGLSYSGDFRMYFGEDKNKVIKIVKPNIDKFAILYQPYINSLIEKGLISFNQNSKIYSQDLSSRVILHNLSLLPKKVQQNLYLHFDKSKKLRDLEDVLMSISKSHHCSRLVREAIDKIVRRSSWSQSLKGLLTAGLIKSFSYSSSKITKMIKV